MPQSASNTNSMEESAKLNDMVAKLTDENKELKDHLNNETKDKQMMQTKIETLQQTVAQRVNEIQEWEKAMEDTKSRLAESLAENQELQKIIEQLKQQIEQFEQETALSEERSQLCQQEISYCQENLCGLKEKLNLMKKLLHKKNEDINRLQAEHDEKCRALATIQKNWECAKSHYKDDMADFKHTVSLKRRFES